MAGEAGIGKTTLTRWLLAEAEESGAAILSGGCYDLTTTPPYGPWLELFRSWFSDPHLPELPDSLRPGGSLTEIGSQDALFELVADCVASASAKHPLVLLLEDLHWTDQASLDLLRYLARLVANWRVLLLVTFRSDELTRRHPLHQTLPVLARETDAARLSLVRLGPEAIDALIVERYRIDDEDRARLTAYVSRVSEGNPLFAGEVMRALEEAGAIARVGETWKVSGLERVQVPTLVRQVIEARLERLGTESRRLLEVAAVIGHEVDLDLWVEVSGADEDTLVGVLEQALEARLVEELPGGTRLRFTHALVRETLYESVISLRRRGWHRTIGGLLASRPQADPDLVAAHYQQASDPQAVPWLVRAGERAQLAHAWHSAVERYEAALQLLQESGRDPNTRGWLQYRIARLERFSHPQAGVAYLEEALRVAEQTGDRALAAAARFSHGVCDFMASNLLVGVEDMAVGADLLEALPLAEQRRLDLGPDAQGQPTITNPRGWLVTVLAFTGRLTEAVRMGEATREGRPSLTALGELGWSHYGDRYLGLGYAYALLGRVDEASDAFVQAKAMFQSTGHYRTQGATAIDELSLVFLRYRTEELDVQAQIVREIEESWRRIDRYSSFDYETAHLRISLLRGQWQAAHGNATRMLMSGSYSPRLVECRRVLAIIGRAQGATEEAWTQVRAMLPAGTVTEPGTQNSEFAFAMQQLAAALALDARDFPTAHAWLEAHDRWLDWSGAVLGRAEGALLWAQYHHTNGDPAQARALAERALENASAPRQPLALIAAHRFLGQLDTGERHFDHAEEHLHESLRLAEACAAPFERALTLLEIANLRMAQGNHDQARALLAEVRSICEPLEATPTLERVTTLQHQLEVAS